MIVTERVSAWPKVARVPHDAGTFMAADDGKDALSQAIDLGEIGMAEPARTSTRTSPSLGPSYSTSSMTNGLLFA